MAYIGKARTGQAGFSVDILLDCSRTKIVTGRGDAFPMCGTEGKTVANAICVQQIEWFHQHRRTTLANSRRRPMNCRLAGPKRCIYHRCLDQYRLAGPTASAGTHRRAGGTVLACSEVVTATAR
jgi:hypothetical protein